MKKELVLVINCKRTYVGVLQKGNAVVVALTGNSNFTGLDTVIGKLKLGCTSLQSLLDQETTKSVTANRRAAKKLILSLMEQLGWSCIAQCNEDEAIFLTSGLDLKKAPTKVSFLATPEKISALPGNKDGEVKFTFKADKNSRFYKVMVGLSETDMKQFGIYTTSRITLTGLESGVVYYIKVMACGARGIESSWSSVFNKRAA